MVLQKKSILIIEDNTDLRENLAELLTVAGYEIIKAENGVSGVEKAIESKPNLILCDIIMPKLNGYGVLNILRKAKETTNIPFIFLTAKIDKSEFRKGMRLGADDYITKPFNSEELLKAVQFRLTKTARQNERWLTISAQPGLLTANKLYQGIETVLKNAEHRRYLGKSLIYKAGETPHMLYLLKSGSVKIFKTNDSGKEYITEIVTPEQFFGFTALINEDSYQESATALEASSVKAIPKDVFFELLFSNQAFLNGFIKLMIQKILDKEEQLLNLAYSSSRKRVAIALLSLKRLYLNKDHEQISLLREHLAQIVGTAKESVCRILTDLKKEGIIDIKEGKISIINEDLLRQIRT